jgi:hypothetical protein
MLSLQDERRRARMAPAAAEWLHGGGWRVVSARSGGGGDRGGITAHRGVLHPDEWVDRARLAEMVEAELGFTLDELRWVYRRGRKSAAQRELRARVDARLLRVADSGGNMSLLAAALGLRVHANRSCPVMTRALRRARAAEALAST